MSVDDARIELDEEFDNLVRLKIIEVDGNSISIKFLDAQYEECLAIGNKRSEAAKARWSKAKGKQKESKSMQLHTDEVQDYADKNRKEENRKEESRIEAQSAADEPHNSPKVTVKSTRKQTAVDRPADCEETVWRDWLRVRGRNPLTETAWAGMISEANKAGISPAEAVRLCAERGWRGFRAEWLEKDKPKRKGGWEPEDLDKQDYRSHDGEKFVAGSAAEYFYGKDYVKRARERYEKPYDRSKEELA